MKVLRVVGPILGLIVVLTGVQPPAAADLDPGASLAERRGCLRCHDVDRPRIGSAFRSIADRYRGVPDSESHLVDWLGTGGRGHWGDDYEMSEQTHLGSGDAQILVRWVVRQ